MSEIPVDDLSESSVETVTLVAREERDEVKEIHKASRKDTTRVNVGRVAVTGALLVTAVAVTVTVYIFLKNEEENNFETAFDQFARTVGDAAVDQQEGLRSEFTSFSNHLTAYAESTNATWPFFTLPLFETFGESTLSGSGAETFVVANIVNEEKKNEYLDYATAQYEAWIEEGHIHAGSLEDLSATGYVPAVTRRTGEGYVEDEVRDRYFCAWTTSPPPRSYDTINWNIGSTFGPLMDNVVELRDETLITPVLPFDAAGVALTEAEHSALHDSITGSHADTPHSFILTPVRRLTEDKTSEVVAVVVASMAWDRSMQNLLPDGVEGLFIVIHNTCKQSFTYELNGPRAKFVGEGDLHEVKYDRFEQVVNLTEHSGPCEYSVHIYPGSDFESAYDSYIPEAFAIVVAITFVMVAVVFCVYDLFVQRRNSKLVSNAARSNAIVSSLFPGAIRDRLLENDEVEKKSWSKGGATATNLKSFLKDARVGGEIDHDTKPMADLFLETTVMFADIVGFTAWASVREPSQVFTLLENVYSGFDEIAKQRRVFKVETVGDCYVAVAGLPEPRKDHAVVMCRFARDCLNKMHSIVRKLEVVLGPDTGDLTIRVGLHSGPVTAGVLRGERSRFQLFGDTMNTTARIESSSEAGRIHVSEDTANLLKQIGKSHWITQREQKVKAKGKGELQTYWLTTSDSRLEEIASSTGSDMVDESTDNQVCPPAEISAPSSSPMDVATAGITGGLDDRTLRLVSWNVDMMLRLLKQIVAQRNALNPNRPQKTVIDENCLQKKSTVLEEVKEIITLPAFDSKVAKRQQDPNTIEVSDFVVDQLQDYVTCIATMYQNNPFHNFDHASHVAMSVGKLMSRIVAPTDIDIDGGEDDSNGDSRAKGNKKAVAATLHDHTYGITSDPLTQFACAFSALIHDVDHTGVPNAQLIKENTTVARMYKNRSVAEQNSFDLSWDLLMDRRYDDLRAMIYSTEDEMRRFRQLVVNGVMATDIVDKDLKALRNARWAKAFHTSDAEQPKDLAPVSSIKSARSVREDTNRKATIVIEHLIQASDVAHTMQHWHIYRKWNERLFMEMYKAYREGRAESDPSQFWYQGEIGFFDFYIIPLARKLKDCGVFGVSSDEYLNYALRNRQEWADRGQEVVAEMMETVDRQSK